MPAMSSREKILLRRVVQIIQKTKVRTQRKADAEVHPRNPSISPAILQIQRTSTNASLVQAGTPTEDMAAEDVAVVEAVAGPKRLPETRGNSPE
jgi:hypothetical protein